MNTSNQNTPKKSFTKGQTVFVFYKGDITEAVFSHYLPLNDHYFAHVNGALVERTDRRIFENRDGVEEMVENMNGWKL